MKTGTSTTDFSDMTFTASGASIFASRMDFLISQDRVELREATTPDVHFGSYLSSTLGAPNLYLRTLDDGEQTLSWDRGFGAKWTMATIFARPWSVLAIHRQWRSISPRCGVDMMTREDQVALVALYVAVCTRSLAEMRDLMNARIGRGTFDEDDAEFLKGAAKEVIKCAHDLQIEAALAEMPAQKDLH